MNRIVIAGAGLAGSRCAETLRALGFEGRIVLVGDERMPPYERPALSKQFLRGEREPGELALRPPAFWAEQGIDLVLGRRITALRAGLAVTDDGDELGWDRFVVATGARPRRMPLPALQEVHVLRTIRDAERLRSALEPGQRLAIIGGGFVGAEVASTARSLGVEVTVLEASEAPFEGLLGSEVARLLAERSRSYGVDLRVGSTTTGLRTDARGKLAAVQLADGPEIACDAALVAVGVEPVRELAGASSPRHVHVCGDAAGGPGHWTSAAVDGAAVAHRLLGVEPPPRPPSFFWSDQFGLRLQLAGDTRGTSTVELDGDGDSFLARYYGEDGRLLAVLGANRSTEIGKLRRELALAA
jgi:3-phenylpropionate/trans-cinnamate dioxygenase ferredoxin reductase subunit